jgi:hypothetical protein
MEGDVVMYRGDLHRVNTITTGSNGATATIENVYAYLIVDVTLLKRVGRDLLSGLGSRKEKVAEAEFKYGDFVTHRTIDIHGKVQSVNTWEQTIRVLDTDSNAIYVWPWSSARKMTDDERLNLCTCTGYPHSAWCVLFAGKSPERNPTDAPVRQGASKYFSTDGTQRGSRKELNNYYRNYNDYPPRREYRSDRYVGTSRYTEEPKKPKDSITTADFINEEVRALHAAQERQPAKVTPILLASPSAEPSAAPVSEAPIPKRRGDW